jgi:erythromycin esterase
MVAEPRHEDEETRALRRATRAIRTRLDSEADLDPLLHRIGDAHYVLLGEASHGTEEFYTWRTRISQRLIREKGFSFIGVEGDWPDCYRVNRYIKTYEDSGSTAYDILHAFERWPTWMWSNREIVHLTEWLRGYNETAPDDHQVGFFGLDVYSLWESMRAVIDFLEHADPEAVAAAKQSYACFEPYGRDEHRYARATAMAPDGCRDEVVAVLTELRRRAEIYPEDDEAAFDAEQNALTAVNAERYYRTMVRADAASWNIRDTHMADTLDRLVDFHRRQRDTVKAIVWAHNTHVGDARATDMAGDGMINIGQLIRERHGGRGVVLVGFSAHRGSVIASRAWGGPIQRFEVPRAAPGSWEDILHADEAHGRLLILDRAAGDPAFHRPRGQRAIGVVYRPWLERYGNYVPTVLPQRYDALLSFEETKALHPLHVEHIEPGEIPETYPTGI